MALEFLDIYNEEGHPTGESLDRHSVHQQGLPHRVIHLWIANSKQEILLQKRSAAKAANPLKWDISVAGHISSGQSTKQALIRECQEEIGLDISQESVQFLTTVFHECHDQNSEQHDREFQDIFFLQKDIAIESLCAQESEVEELKWLPWLELEKMIISQDPHLVSHPEEFEILREFLNKL